MKKKRELLTEVERNAYNKKQKEIMNKKKGFQTVVEREKYNKKAKEGDGKSKGCDEKEESYCKKRNFSR